MGQFISQPSSESDTPSDWRDNQGRDIRDNQRRDTEYNQRRDTGNNQRRVGSRSAGGDDGSVTPPSLAAAASIAAHQRLLEELNRVAEEQRNNINVNVESETYNSSTSEVEEDLRPRNNLNRGVEDSDSENSFPATRAIRELLRRGQLQLRRELNMLSESDDEPEPASTRTRKNIRWNFNSCVSTLPPASEPKSQESYNEFRMDVIRRSGLTNEKNWKLLTPGTSNGFTEKDKVEENQLFEPSSSSLRTVIRNAKFGLGRNNYHSDDYEPLKSGASMITDPVMVAFRNRMTPNRRKVVDRLQTKTFCVSYVNEGTGILSASQDNRIRVYQQSSLRKRYVRKRIIEVPFVGWSILDVDVSPHDGRYIVYSTWNNIMYQYDLENENAGWQEMLLESEEQRFGIFSVKFNSSGTEIVAGTTTGLYIYSREVDKCVMQVVGHEDDINAVCFVEDSDNLILSSGDDGLVKMWDRRTMGSFGDGEPVRVFSGHRDGVTFIDSRKDGRYFLTNSKDQTIKVWDVRLGSRDEGIQATRKSVSTQLWDYRWQYTPITTFKTSNLPGDTSIMTLRGHSVLHTLIRARFSPDHTGKRFIYTGCARSGLVIYDIFTGDIHKKLNDYRSVVRDAVWHPYENEIVTSSWDGNVHVWRHDSRGPTGKDLDSDSQVVQEWDSTDEFDEPIIKNNGKRRKVNDNRNMNHVMVRRGPSDVSGMDVMSRTRMEMKIAQVEDANSDSEDDNVQVLRSGRQIRRH